MNNFKKLIITSTFFALAVFSAYGQNPISFGIKGGLNYGATGEYFDALSFNRSNPDKNIGYHIGVFGKMGDEIYLRPEFVYTAIKSDYDNAEFNVRKIDVPILVGVQLLDPISVFAGPAMQFILGSDFRGVDIDDIRNKFKVGFNFGIAVDFNTIGIDLRYERGFDNNEASFMEENQGRYSRIDTKPNHLILSLSITL
ncbi:outer membrane beta-barrel protein [Winogradskyella thalassocola]|uniref:Outer membrane protein beta-barrel domain-containing protein n=1 Tax=Winogradskyella thalassocola TaxID=262004 RepID=A0A1G8BUD1_9FLAO|nr:outer membrane beta-barrel protein [Winogradskyella thalassocola]SDH36896.1 Outer membrane protein beta-barrel domain-containing protein [Winogradskyella thalassocola]